MSKPRDIPIWKTAPILRLLPPLIAGITTEWYVQVPLLYCFAALVCFSIAFFTFTFLPVAQKFKLQVLQGFLLQLVLIAFGMLITWNKDLRHRSDWYGSYYLEGDCLLVNISEPLVEKPRSFKADAAIERVIRDDSSFSCTGKLLLYFSKDSQPPRLRYGDRILISKKLVTIKNSGNPGAFNYEQYAAFQQTFHNVFLKQADWIKLEGNNPNPFQQFLFNAREKILAALRTNISNSKDELGIAEALLIGYTNDLDKDLVQAYSNTGVVHIIAISGMHLALIYGLLVFLFAKIPFVKKSKWLRLLLILGCLWLFSLLTGASASVIRSAVMFSFITTGNIFFKKSGIFSSLAASAFVMLCYNPYYLWDVGFQLSYLAVIGIVLFQKPVYQLFYFNNKLPDHVWQATALTTAAQVLTFPVCIYYFHQFPLLFLITNLVAVPLSTIILYAAIVLVAFSWIPFVGLYAGKLTAGLLWLMNKFIFLINELPFAVWDKIPASLASTWLLYGTVLFTAAWLLQKNRQMLRLTLICTGTFVLVHAVAGWKVKTQQKIIVYNVPRHQAIDFVTANQYLFIGDSILLEEGALQNFHLKPGRVSLQLDTKTNSLPGFFQTGDFCQFNNQRILIIDRPLIIENTASPLDIDLVVISRNASINIAQLAKALRCKQFVFDASNSLWKIAQWKQDCDKLNLRFHSVPDQGAFTSDL